MKPKLITMLRGYDRPTFLADLSAGVTVALVALPLCIAIAIASGTTPEKGIITAIVGGFLVSAFGGSRVQIGGPTGAFIVVVYSIIADHGFDGLLIATLMAGVILVIAGFLRLGTLVHKIPESVIEGFTIGIGIIIAASQLKDFMGLQVDNVPADFLEKIPALWAARYSLSLPSLGIGIVAIIAMVVLRVRFPKFPGLIFVVAILSALIAWLHWPVADLASRYGEIGGQLPSIQLPNFADAPIQDLILPAVTIAFLAAIESLLSAKVADRMMGTAHRSNAELLAQGVANIGSVMVGGIPVTGAIARTATNIKAGGQTPVAGMVHALAILIIFMVAGPLASHMALPVLAAILLVTAWNMAEPTRWSHYLAEPWDFKLVLLTTLLLTVILDLTVAIFVGTAMGIGLQKWREKGS